MAIVKEFVQNESDKCFIVRRSDYGSSLAAINELHDEIVRDFPIDDLDQSKLRLTHYNGPRYKGTYGIEFNLDAPAPAGYTQVKYVEFTL